MKALYFLLLVFAADHFAAGVKAYRDGDWQSAKASFELAIADAGESVTAELYFNQAMTALQLQDWTACEQAAQRAAEVGGIEFAALRDFLIGNVAYGKCLSSEADAQLAVGKIRAYQTAIAHAELAIANWDRAAKSREEWPQAQRNVQRGKSKISELKSKLKELKEQLAKRNPGQKTAKDPSADDAQPETSDLPPEAKAPEQWTAKDQQDLLDKLKDKQKKKVMIRRKQSETESGKVEKDW